MLESSEHLFQNIENYFSREVGSIPHELIEGPPREVLSHQVDKVIGLIDSFVSNDVGVRKEPQSFDLVLQGFLALEFQLLALPREHLCRKPLF